MKGGTRGWMWREREPNGVRGSPMESSRWGGKGQTADGGRETNVWREGAQSERIPSVGREG